MLDASPLQDQHLSTVYDAVQDLHWTTNAAIAARPCLMQVLTTGIAVDGRKYFYAGQSNSQLKARSCMLIQSNSLQEVSRDRAWHCVLSKHAISTVRYPLRAHSHASNHSSAHRRRFLQQKSHMDILWAIATYLCSRLKTGQRIWATFRQSRRPLSDLSASASYSRPALQSLQLVITTTELS